MDKEHGRRKQILVEFLTKVARDFQLETKDIFVLGQLKIISGNMILQ